MSSCGVCKSIYTYNKIVDLPCPVSVYVYLKKIAYKKHWNTLEISRFLFNFCLFNFNITLHLFNITLLVNGRIGTRFLVAKEQTHNKSAGDAFFQNFHIYYYIPIQYV